MSSAVLAVMGLWFPRLFHATVAPPIPGNSGAAYSGQQWRRLFQPTVAPSIS